MLVTIGARKSAHKNLKTSFFENTFYSFDVLTYLKKKET